MHQIPDDVRQRRSAKHSAPFIKVLDVSPWGRFYIFLQLRYFSRSPPSPHSRGETGLPYGKAAAVSVTNQRHAHATDTVTFTCLLF